MASAAALYAAVYSRWSVGMANDDSLYLLAAKSLLHGRFVSLQYPNHPPLNDPMPGYPLLLAPFVGVAAGHWSWLKLTSVALTLGSGWLLWELVGFWLSGAARALATLLWLFHPAVVAFSPSLMSEPFFIFLVLAFLVCLKRFFENRGGQWPAALLISWAVMVRPQGALLWASAALAILWRRNRPLPKAILCLPVLCLVGFALRNEIVTHHSLGYARLWMSAPAGRPSLPSAWAQTAAAWISDGLLGGTPLPFWSIVALAVVLGTMIVVALRRRAGRSEVSDRLLIIMFLYFGLYTLLQTTWVSFNVRYVLPILPFLLLGVLLYTESSARPAVRFVGVAINLLLLVLYLAHDAALIRDRGASEGTVPRQTYAWMRSALPVDSFILSSKPSTLALYSGRYATFALPAPSAAAFVTALRAGHVTHVLIQPYSIASPAWDALWRQSCAWVISSPSVFELRYTNPVEHTAVYAIRPDSQREP